jgi:hypothetical protein
MRMTAFRFTSIAICGAAALLVAIPAQAQDKDLASHPWVSTEWEIKCPKADNLGNDPCEGQDNAKILFKEYLEDASVWFKGLGFRGPKIKTSSGKYQAEIIRDKDALDKEGKRFSGYYDPIEELIFLNEEDFFAMGGEGDTFASPDFRVQTQFMLTAVHELFHAIQFSYSDKVCGEGRDWMCEGMADAAMRAYHDTFESGLNIAMKRRKFNVPLHEPGHEEWGYGTWQFWLDVGRHINSTAGIKYLQDVMTNDPDAKSGLFAVDYGLESNGKLYEILPWFFTQRNPDVDFGKPLRRDVRLEAGQHDVEKRISNIVVQAVAGRAVKLRILRDSDKAIGVKIMFARPDVDLHLIVDNTRYDRRNVFYTVHDGDKPLELDVVIANVADGATFSRENKLDLVVQVSDEYAAMAVDVGGSSVDDAITTFPIELENNHAQVQIGQVGKLDDSYLGKGYSEGIVNPCVLIISGFAARRPDYHSPVGVMIHLQTSGPITPGKYPIVDPPPGNDYSKEMPQGEAVAGAGVPDLPDGENDMQFVSGYLTINSVSEALIQGNIWGLGTRKEFSTETGRDEVVESRMLAARFSILAEGSTGKDSDKPYACLKSK